jgi:excisionase family DNA binding protein
MDIEESMNSEKLLLRPVEAAEMLGMSKTKVYNMITAGIIPSIRVGGNVRIPADRLRAWIDELSKAK